MPLIVCLLLLAVAAGCSSRRSLDLLEARLRQRDDRLAELQSRLDSTRSELAAARRETSALRKQLADAGQDTLLPEQADALFRAEGIQISQWRTGGLDRDGRPGDDQLTAVLLPHDAQGETVKVPGKIELRLYDLSQPEGRQHLGSWRYDAEQSSQHWHRGFLGSGYLFRLPWQREPTSEELWLHARLTTPDGRQFETSRRVHITPSATDTRVAEDAPRFGDDPLVIPDADTAEGVQQLGHQQPAADGEPFSDPREDKAMVGGQRAGVVQRGAWWEVETQPPRR